MRARRGAVKEVFVNQRGTKYTLDSSNPYFKNDGGAADASNYNLYFDHAGQTLTMKDLALVYALGQDEDAGILFHEGYGPITIILEGNNTIVSSTDPGNDFDIGIKHTEGDTTITGSGSVTILGAGTTGFRYGIEAKKLVMESGVVHATGGEYGVNAKPVMNGGQLTGVGGIGGIRTLQQTGSNIMQWVGANETDALSRDGETPNFAACMNNPYASLRESYQITVTGGTTNNNFQWFWPGRDATVTAAAPAQFSRWEVTQAPVGFALTDPNVSPAAFAMPVGNVSLLAHYKPTSLTLNETTLPLTVGGTQALAVADVQPDYADQDVTWQSSNLSVATVDANGNVQAVAPGTAIITATSTAAPDVTATCNVTVTPKPVPAPPQTGDPAPLALWALLSLLSLACAATFLHRMRKRV